MDFALRIACADDPIIEPPRKGFACIPKRVTARRDLTAEAKTVLDAIIGSCFGDTRSTDITASMIADRSGLPLRSAERAIALLKKRRLIDRYRDHSRPGKPFLTALLFDPMGTKSAPEFGGDHTAKLADHTAKLADHTAKLADTPSYIGAHAEELLLDLKKTTTTEDEQSSSSFHSTPDPVEPSRVAGANSELSEKASKLFPEAKADPGLIEKEIAIHGVERVTLAIELARILAKDAKRRPRIFRWLHGTLDNWRDRTIESIRAEIDATRGPKPVQPVFFWAADQPTPEVAPKAFSQEWSRLMREGRHGEAAALCETPPDEKKPAAGPLAKVSPQPAQDTVQAVSLGAAGPSGTACQWSGRGSNPQPPHCERDGSLTPVSAYEDPRERAGNAGNLAEERRVSNAALSPDNPERLNYTPESSLDQNQLSGPGD